jgi:hypothetical protein
MAGLEERGKKKKKDETEKNPTEKIHSSMAMI